MTPPAPRSHAAFGTSRTTTAAPRDDAPRSLPTIERVLGELGSTFLAPLAPVPEARRRVGGVVVFDRHADQAFPDDAIVLAVGLAPGDELLAMLHEVAGYGACAIVLREPVEVDDALRDAAEAHGIALLGLTRGASWTQLSAMVSALLASNEPAGDDGPPSGDLFSLANAISGLLDAPITIEDRNTRVLAFSSRQDGADPSRIETILERQVPERYARLLTDAGFFKRLYAADVPVYIQLQADGTDLKLRCAIAVRAGGEILGSIWAAVPAELSDERTRALVDAANVVALQLLRLRAGADVERRMQADLISTALEGREGSAYALERLGIDEVPVVVLAAAIDADGGDAEGEGDRQAQRERAADAISLHLSAVHPKASAALLGTTIYGVLPVHGIDGGERRAARMAEEFLARVGSRLPVVVGVGLAAVGPRGVVRSRERAERALRVRLERGAATSRVAVFDEVHVDSLLLELRDRVREDGEQATGGVAKLLAHDRAHDTGFVATLRAWLDHMGEVAAAADALHIHANTLRYRLRRLAEIGGMDLADPEVRFSAQLQLRIVPELARDEPPRG